ncbi:MAG: VWA domain-containing protein [Candidatus Woesearchaeota archaeon]
MHITFSNPLYLWFLFLIPVLIFAHFFFFKRSRSKALIFSNIQAIRRMAKGNIISANLTHLVLRSLIVVAIVVAASGAKLNVLGDKSDVNIVFALDSSASMSSPDVGSSRFDTAKYLISNILSTSPRGGEYALISFSGASFIRQRFTFERAELLLTLDNMDVARLGGTDVGGAIIAATNLFESRSEGGRVLILLSDGLNNAGSFISSSPDEIVDYARDNLIVIHSIAIGGEGGPLGFLPEYYQIPAMFDDSLVNLLSEGTGGSSFRIESFSDVEGVVESLDFETSRAYITYDLAYWAFIVIFVLLSLEWILANTIYRRVL